MRGRATAHVLIRCDGGPALGLGHVKRCLAVANVLRRDHGLKALFAGRFEDGAAALLEAARFPVIASEPDEARWLTRIAAESGARAFLFDIRTDLSRGALDALRPASIVTLDDGSERRLAADLALLPPTPQVRSLDWTGFPGEALIGWAWQVQAAKPLPRATPLRQEPPLRLLVTMGGADPAGLTGRAARLLAPLADSIDPLFVIGPAFAQPALLRAELQTLWPKAEIAEKPDSLSPLMAKADLALVAYGVTAQELAAAGVPALYLGLTADHVQSAEALAATGAGVSLGRHDALDDAALRGAVAALIADPARRDAMALAGPRALDGRGAERLAARIADLLHVRKSA